MSRPMVRVLYDVDSKKKLFRLFKDKDFYQRATNGTYTGKAEDLINERNCFLKLTSTDNIDTEQQIIVNNLTREGKFQFCYPFIERVYGNVKVRTISNGESKYYYGVSVELVEGMDLRDLWKKQGDALKTDEGEKKIFRNMLQFLYGMRYYIHFDDPFYLHRDIKPENVMIDQNGDVKIIDFDFAHISGSTDTFIGKNYLGFTRGYTSPRGAEYVVNLQNEFYSVGRLFFFWLCGKDYYELPERSGMGFFDLPYVKDPDLGFGTKTERYPEKFRAEEYKRFRMFLDRLCEVSETKSYKTVDDVIEDFLASLQERYKLTTRRQLEELLGIDGFPILCKKTESNVITAPNVCFKIGRKPYCGATLDQYMMRDVVIGDAAAMMIYNIDNEIYYIPLEGTRRTEYREREDYKIRSGDAFVTKDGIEFKFKY